MRRLAVVAVALVACTVVPAHAQTLELKFKQGDTYKYSLHLSGSLDYTAANAPKLKGNVKFDAKAGESVAVTAVEDDGTADLSITFSKLTVTTTGRDPGGNLTTSTSTQTNALPPQQLKVSADGRILSINGESTDAQSPFGVLVGSDLAFAVLPDTAVKPGDRWSKSYDQSQPDGRTTVHVTTDSTYLRDESIKGVNSAVVETKSTANFTLNLAVGTTAMHGTSDSVTTSWIDPGTRRLLKSTANATLKAELNSVETGVTITGTQSLDLEPA
ncbi:MAG TPA: hypothetical protein VFL29_01205 [Candidatus Dormibacteraeota bacterium]|nr:hypothetical protein [Candidatus Dormibacteraeota bacterium]